MLSKRKRKLIGIGAIIGLVNGFFGSGGGIVAVGLLKDKFNLSQKQAHATSLLVMLPVSITSSIVYIFNGHFPLKSGSLITFGVIVGGLLGSVLLRFFRQDIIRYIFLALMFFSGIKLLFL